MRYLLLLIFVIAATLTTIVAIETKQLLTPKTTSSVLSEQTSTGTASPSAILYFSKPSITYLNLNTPVTTDIMINSGSSEISEIQIEPKYNPSMISDMTTSIPDQMFLGNKENFSVVFNEVNPSFGRVSLAIKTKSTGFPKKGIGTVATISFLPKTTSTGMISFTPASSVSSPHSSASILAKTYNTTFTYKPISTGSAQLNSQP